MTIPEFTMEDFSQALGETFELDLGGQQIRLTLDQVEELPKRVREAGCFRLQFSGPHHPLLPQAIYPLERGGETYEIFIVPVARDGESTTYEAIFN